MKAYIKKQCHNFTALMKVTGGRFKVKGVKRREGGMLKEDDIFLSNQ